MRSAATPKIDKYLIKHYLHKPVRQIALKIGRSETFVVRRLRALGLVRPPEVIERNKQAGRRKPGEVPPNKGKRQKEWMSARGRKKVKASQFKKGNLPHNTRSDFDIVIRRDSSGHDYQHIRVSLSKWIPLHRYNWERVHGKIPPKMKLVFKDGNTMNCAVNNLELLTAAELMKRNSWHNYPEELGRAIQLRGALNRQINKHLKRIKNEK
jgi:hypothetical protein